MARGMVWVLVAALGITAGCATTQALVEKPVTDFKQLAGAWNGWTTSTSGSYFRVNLLVQADGQYKMIFEQNHFYPNRFIRAGRGLRFEHGTGTWTGTVTLVEAQGKDYLRFVFDTGALWIEFERAP